MTAVSPEVRERLAALAAPLHAEPWIVEWRGGAIYRVMAGLDVDATDAFIRAVSPDVVSGLLADLTAAEQRAETLAKAARQALDACARNACGALLSVVLADRERTP